MTQRVYKGWRYSHVLFRVVELSLLCVAVALLASLALLKLWPVQQTPTFDYAACDRVVPQGSNAVPDNWQELTRAPNGKWCVTVR